MKHDYDDNIEREIGEWQRMVAIAKAYIGEIVTVNGFLMKIVRVDEGGVFGTIYSKPNDCPLIFPNDQVFQVGLKTFVDVVR